MNGIRFLAVVVGWTIALTALSGCATRNPLDWAARLEPGWQFMGGGGPPWSAAFVRPDFTARPDGHRFGWVRTEFKEPRPALSLATLVEVDCNTDQSRSLEEVSYSKHNLRGVELERRKEVAAWRRAPDDLDTFVPYACADTPAKRRAALSNCFCVPDTRHRRMRSRVDLDPEP